MSFPNEDEVDGKWEQAKGWVKDKAGESAAIAISRPRAKLSEQGAKPRKPGAK